MAFTFGFYNSLKGDRRYNTEQVSEIFDGILIDGIIPSIGQLFVVKTANNRMQITVGTGRAWFDHTWSKNDSVKVLTVPPCDVTRPRYDAVVLEVNHADRVNSIKVVQGEPAVNPLKPTLVNTDKVHQYPLAYISVRAGTSEIKASDIENTVGRSPTPFATGVLETVPLDDLWNQWKGEFTEWFDNIKAQLSGNIATNLQNQINQVRDSIPAKATTNEVLAGSNDTKFVTPSGVKSAINANRIYVKDNNGVTYTWKARSVLPMVNTFGQNEIDKDSLERGYVVRLANYEVLHYLDKVWVFDKSGSVRNYSVAVSLEANINETSGVSLVGSIGYWSSASTDTVTKRAMPIRGTNSYFAFTPTSLYKITVGSSTPKVELYYSWPTTDGTPVALSYVNSDWSALVLGFDKYKFRIFKIPNGYVAQPTIYTFDLNETFGNLTYSVKKVHGIAGRYAIFIVENVLAMADILTGSLVRSGRDFPVDDLLYCFVDDVHGMFNIIGTTTFYSFTSTSTSYASYNLTPSGTGSVMAGGYSTLQTIDVENGTCYFRSGGYVYRYQYVGTFRISTYVIPDNLNMGTVTTMLRSINGSSSFITCYAKGVTPIDRNLISTYPLIPVTMAGPIIYLEKYPSFVANYGTTNNMLLPASLLPVPKLVIFERFIYCYSAVTPEIGMAKFDTLAREFIGIPI